MRPAAMRAVSFCSAIPALLRKMWILVTARQGAAPSGASANRDRYRANIVTCPESGGHANMRGIACQIHINRLAYVD
jgi:hypothetical protein